MNTEFPLKELSILRPERIRWMFPSTGEDLLLHVRSKSLRKFFRTVDSLLAREQIHVEFRKLELDDFAQWLEYYTKKMHEYGHEVMASIDSYHAQVQRGRLPEGIFLTQHAQMIGSGIITFPDESSATLAWLACDRVSISSEDNASLGAIVDYFFLRQSYLRQIEHISAGTSRNAFGVVNSYGYLDYKLRMGYLPSVATGYDYHGSVPLDINGNCAFFGEQSGKFSLFLHQEAKTSQIEQLRRFASANLLVLDL